MSASAHRAIRGAIEGFYGTFYTQPERLRLLQFLGAHDYNHYIYAPKNDRQHRARWREPYPERIMTQFQEATRVARASGIDFCYSLSPGVDLSYASEDDFRALTSKLQAFYDLGVRSFSLLLDDIHPEFRAAADRTRYRSYGEAHADLSNRVYAWLSERDEPCSLSMCPTDYHGTPPFSDYLHQLGCDLHPAIDMFYTGPRVCSTTIDTTDVEAFARAARRPPILWDNYPVNDLAMERELHLGAIRGRDPALPSVLRGVVVNLMSQPEASRVALATYAAYLADPATYHPARAWTAALTELGGEESTWALRALAENSLKSCLHEPESEALQQLNSAALAALEQGSVTAPALAELREHLTELDEACYHLKFRMDNLALRGELLPWIELLEYWLWAARYALDACLDAERNQESRHALTMAREFFDRARCHHKRNGGEVLAPLVEQALRRAAQVAS